MGEPERVHRTVPLMIVGLLVAAVLVCAAPLGATGSAAANAGATCHAPLLEGLTFKLARAIAGRAGCKLRVKGNPLTRANVQTVARQTPAAGGVASTVTVWLNRVCRRGGARGPEIHEPAVTVGATKLVSGFYTVGGPPPHYFSAPKCPRRPPAPPGPGTVEVVDASGAVVATQTSVARQFIEIPLPAGSYTIRGTFLNVTRNGAHPSRSEALVIPVGHTVRQDFIWSVP